MPLPGPSARHRAPARRLPALAVPGVLLLALTTPLAGLGVIASTSAAPASAGTHVVADAGGDLTTAVGSDLLAERRATADRAARDRAVAPAPAPVEPPPPPPPPPPSTVRPSDGVLTSPFGRRWGRLHAGIDLATGMGAPVRAAAAGTVTSAGPEGGYGLAVRVRHPDGAETVYGHLSVIGVAAGQPVVAGQDLGREGSTGRSTGPHLHFEVRYGGAPVDPAAWLRERGVGV